MKIANLMTKEPITLNESATVLEAVKEMEESNCGILPIVDDDKDIKGVITDRDIIVRAIAKNKNLEKTCITEVMSKNPVFCEEEDSLQHAVSQMTRHNIRRVLIKNKKGAFCGILSLIDVIHRVKDKTSLADLFKDANAES